MEYTAEEFNEFLRLYNLSGSRDQVDRIESRLHMPKFVEKHGEEKCDAMFSVIQEEGL
tara:strand:+ start:808 stop:981 length:174 start_codon:yes stop_codon:yes gene_type:complete